MKLPAPFLRLFNETFTRNQQIAAIVPDAEANWEKVLEQPGIPEPLRNGQPVTVFNDSAHGVFVAYGVVLSSEWNALVGDYHYEIQVCQSQLQINGWGFHLQAATPEVMRMGFVAIPGGFPQLRSA